MLWLTSSLEFTIARLSGVLCSFWLDNEFAGAVSLIPGLMNASYECSALAGSILSSQELCHRLILLLLTRFWLTGLSAAPRMPICCPVHLTSSSQIDRNDYCSYWLLERPSGLATAEPDANRFLVLPALSGSDICLSRLFHYAVQLVSALTASCTAGVLRSMIIRQVLLLQVFGELLFDRMLLGMLRSARWCVVHS